ncbi:MAG: flagellar FliJ family protein [Pseudooceanicola sp.]|nr:flagellar FliJ family protein [Pseudooceanicola sp.]
MDDRRIAALALLERVRRHEIESETQALGQLRAQSAQLEQNRRDLEQSLEDGAQCADPALRSYLGNFVRSVRGEIARGDRAIAEIETSAAEIADRVAEGFREIKSYEILRLDALARRVADLERREETEMSDLAQIRWWRSRRRNPVR